MSQTRSDYGMIAVCQIIAKVDHALHIAELSNLGRVMLLALRDCLAHNLEFALNRGLVLCESGEISRSSPPVHIRIASPGP